MKQWVVRMKNGHLPPSWAWVAYKFQLWPSIRYGIGTMTNDLEEAEEFLGEHDCSLLNLFGVVRTVKVGWRRIHSTFEGLSFSILPQNNWLRGSTSFFNTTTLQPHWARSSTHHLRYDSAFLAILTPQLQTSITWWCDWEKSFFMAKS